MPPKKKREVPEMEIEMMVGVSSDEIEVLPEEQVSLACAIKCESPGEIKGQDLACAIKCQAPAEFKDLGDDVDVVLDEILERGSKSCVPLPVGGATMLGSGTEWCIMVRAKSIEGDEN